MDERCGQGASRQRTATIWLYLGQYPFHAEMKRSTNGGGENSPKLEGEDDFYELFFAGLEQKENKNLNE